MSKHWDLAHAAAGTGGAHWVCCAQVQGMHMVHWLLCLTFMISEEGQLANYLFKCAGTSLDLWTEAHVSGKALWGPQRNICMEDSSATGTTSAVQLSY